MERFVVKQYSERLPDIFKIYDTVEEEYVKIGECNDLLCSTQKEAQEVCNVLNKVIAFC